MVRVSNTELNIMQFYTNPNFLLGICKDLYNLNQKEQEVFKITSCRSYARKKYFAPEDPI